MKFILIVAMALVSSLALGQKKDSPPVNDSTIVLTEFQVEQLKDFDRARARVQEQAQQQAQQIEQAALLFNKSILDAWAEWKGGRKITDADSLVLSDDGKKISILKKRTKPKQ